MSYCFPKTARILTRRHFKWLTRNSQHFLGKWVIIEFYKARPRENGSSMAHSQVKLGITVTKQYGKAHDRNRIKRLVRESYRLCRSQMPLGLQLVVRPKACCTLEPKLKTSHVLSDFLRFIESLNLSSV